MTRSFRPPQPPVRCSGGFTLVELMVTMVIIAILAGLALGAYASARQTARIQKTRNTIEKINAIVMERYEAFQTRRLPVTTADLKAFAQARLSWSGTGNLPKSVAAEARLQMLRALMLVELPDRWSDVDANFDLKILPASYKSPLQTQYQRKYGVVKSWAGTDTNRKQLLANNASAECLYMIVMSDPEAASQFQSSEIGDVDGDGLPEFLDGWGTPIRFIRWPAGFVPPLADSDLQVADAGSHHDPFDPGKIYSAAAYALYPLIYSAGPDRIYDINEGNYLNGTVVEKFYFPTPPPPPTPPPLLDPYVNAPTDPLGKPLYLDDSEAPSGATTRPRHYDNIHNHRSEGR